MAVLTEIVIDSLKPSVLAQFWDAALDEYALRPYDKTEIDRLAELGLTPETDTSVALDGPGLTIFFQMTTSPKASRNRIHFDVCSQNRSAEIQRLTSLGASIRDEHDTYTVMLDPDGNEFCVTDPKS